MLSVVVLAAHSATAQTATAPRNRTFRLTSTATVPVPPVGTNVLDLWLPVPHSDKYQDVRYLVIETTEPYTMSADDKSEKLKAPYTIETDRYGNQMLHMTVKKQDSLQWNGNGERLKVEDFTPLVVTLTAQITRREHLTLRANGSTVPALAKAKQEKPDPNMARWLAPDRLVPLDAKIRQQAEEVVANAKAKTPLEKARAIYEHVVSTVTYDKTGQGWGRGDIYYACDARRGNCTDFHAIFIGYCRALGIPARFSIGLPLPVERGKGEIKGYHCWAEFFTPATGWVPIDASEAAKNPDKRNYFFGAHDENRVEFTRGRDLELMPKQAGPPLNYFVYPYAEADGQPLEVGRTYTFSDVTTQ